MRHRDMACASLSHDTFYHAGLTLLKLHLARFVVLILYIYISPVANQKVLSVESSCVPGHT
jgi:hypothetical protein